MGNTAAELEKLVKTGMAAQQAADAAIATATTFREIPLEHLRESKWNPRRTFEAKGLADLTASVKEKGVLVPLLVRPVGQALKVTAVNQREASVDLENMHGLYEIVAGARRFRAAKAAGLKAVPAIVRELTDDQALEAQVIENLQRADVHPLEEAEGYRRLLAVSAAALNDAKLLPAARTWRILRSLLDEGFTRTELARRLGSRARVPALQIGRRPRVTARTAMRVEKLYRQIMEPWLAGS